MGALVQDLRYGWRVLVKSPGPSLIAVLALGLGIGANSAIFSVVDAVLLRPLPYKDPGRLVVVWETKLSKGIQQEYVSAPDYHDWVLQNRVFDQIAAIKTQPAVITGGQLPERVEAAFVAPGAFSLLGVKAARGRTFLAEEDQPGKNTVAVLSYGLWQRRFGGDGEILGKSVIVDGKSYLIVGVTPQDFRLLDTPSELWVPYTLDAKEENANQRGFRTLRVIAHLKSGVTREQAQSEMRSIEDRLAQQYPDVDIGWSTKVVPLRDQMVGDIGTTLWTLTAAVVFVLLIACVNVANLLLARAGSREKEIALRAAIGAKPSRLARQLLTESVLLGLAGGAVGLLLAAAGVAALQKFGPADLPRMKEIGIDWRVVVFTGLVSILTGVIFGLAPVMGSVRADLNSVLKTSGRGTTSGRSRARLRNTLVVAEIASCVVLLTGAGLLIQSFVRLENVSPGFRPDHVLTMQITLPDSRYDGWQVAGFYQRLLDRLQALPGVRYAGIARNLPLSGVDASLNFTVENRPVVASADQPRAKYRAASADYFTALGIPLLRGRFLERTDGQRTPGVVVINNTLANSMWPNEDPIGKRIKAGFDDSIWCTIVGIAGDVKHTGLDAKVNPETYYDYQQVPIALMSFVEGTMTIVLRTNGAPESLAAPVRNEVRNLDPNLAVFNVKTMDSLVAGSVTQPRFRALLVGAFAAVALILASIGLYGVITYSVTQRTNELGVRMALGAQKSDVLGLILGQGTTMAGIGIGIGLVLSFGLMRVISKLLFDVRAWDPATFVVTAGVILVVAITACLIPALRAMRLDPVVALRYE